MKKIKPPKIHRLRTMAARNFSGIDKCCGTDSLRQLCKECNVRLNLLDWALNGLAREFSTKIKSINFVFRKYWKVNDGSLVFKMQARTTKERVFLEISTPTVDDARNWQDKIRQSAKQSDKKK